MYNYIINRDNFTLTKLEINKNTYTKRTYNTYKGKN